MFDFVSKIDPSWKIEKMEFARLSGDRPMKIMENARLGVHGKELGVQTMRVHFGGETGFGRFILPKNKATDWLGVRIIDMFDEFGVIKPEFYRLEYPVLDCLGNHFGTPIYKMITDGNAEDGYKVPYYDSTIYFSDLRIDSHEEAAQMMKEEVQAKMARGHRHFKMKLGRGALHMPFIKGMERDIALTKAVREVIGKDAYLMIDANNGYNLNMTKEVLMALKEDDIYWAEEPFHEDNAFLKNLKEWKDREGISTLVADGEGGNRRSPHLIEWAMEGMIDVIQHDIVWDGFSFWLRLARILDRHNILSAPHNFGSPYGNIATAQIYPYIKNFTFIEWDEATVEGIDFSGYKFNDGFVKVPKTPGFGLKLDDKHFEKMVKETGWVLG